MGRPNQFLRIRPLAFGKARRKGISPLVGRRPASKLHRSLAFAQGSGPDSLCGTGWHSLISLTISSPRPTQYLDHLRHVRRIADGRAGDTFERVLRDIDI